MSIAKSNKWHVLAVILAIPALFSHLGYIPLDMSTDEARRALVALEMDLTGNYLTPTLNGELYFNKPPLYNWLILASFRLWGDYSSWSLRFPMAVSVIGFSFTIFYWLRRYVPYQIAAMVALLQLVNGRVLFYETLYGLIDITYSWATFTAFMVIYEYDKRKKYGLLFLYSYLICALGFMMKGLPSLVFQGMTLVAWLGYQRKWRVLWHPAHFFGIAVFLGIVGTYYALSIAAFGFPLQKAMYVLWDESVKRTGVAFGVTATMLHILTFPFEYIFHFLPFTLFILLFYPSTPQKSWSTVLASLRRYTSPMDSFLRFCAITFVANVLVYWVSPQVYARYTLMLLPLFFTLVVVAYYQQEGHWQRRWIEVFMGSVMGITVFAVWIAFGIEATRKLPYVWGACLATSGVVGVMCWWYFHQKEVRLDIFVVFLLVARISFNFLFVPPREAKRQRYLEDNVKAALMTMDAAGNALPLKSYKTTIGDDGATDVNSFHIEATRRKVLPISFKKEKGVYYLADSSNLAGEKYKEIARLTLYPERPAKIVRFDQAP